VLYYDSRADESCEELQRTLKPYAVQDVPWKLHNAKHVRGNSNSQMQHRWCQSTNTILLQEIDESWNGSSRRKWDETKLLRLEQILRSVKEANRTRSRELRGGFADTDRVEKMPKMSDW